jgi:glycerol kinase
MGVFLGIDHGGSTTTCLVLSQDGDVLGRYSVPTERSTPFPGGVEHDADSFVTGSISAMSGALETAQLRWTDVLGVGVANQGETSMAWDSKTKTPVGPALSWQDRRTAQKCEELRENGFDDIVHQISGLAIDPYFSASKFAWLSQASDAARSARERGTLRMGGSDAYLIYQLTGGSSFLTDPSTASRSALMSLEDLTWSKELMGIFDIPEGSLPTIQPSASNFGEIKHPDVPASGILVSGNLVDAHAALYLHDVWSPKSIKATFGTGAFIETTVGPKAIRPTNGLTPFLGWLVEDIPNYVLEGSVFDVGAAVRWLVEMGLAPSAAETEQIAFQALDSGGLTFLPSFSGLAAPMWDSSARAQLSGMSLKTRPEHVVRALLEGIASSVGEAILLLLEEAGHDEVVIKADGGPSSNAFLMGQVADYVGLPIRVSREPDITALGAAALSAVSLGYFSAEDLKSFEPDFVEFEPQSNTATRQSKRASWQASVRALADQKR